MSTPASAMSSAKVSVATRLIDRFETATATIGVVGMGYVGLPLAHAMFEAGFRVLGYDLDEEKVRKLNRGEPYIHHLGDSIAKTLAGSDRFEATADASRLGEPDAILLCVPTPLGPHREPDLSYVTGSTRLVAKTLRQGQLVVLVSTTYPGTTRNEMLPILEESGLRCGTDFFLGYSPEREDPGRRDRTTRTIPKLVGGVDPVSTDVTVALYGRVIDEVHRVSSAEVAEASKLVENIYRAVNIAMVNELKTLFDSMGIDIWEVIAAAATKPFGYQPFYPGPGLGGHCIPIDPFYLSWKAREMGRHTRFIELAGEINASMPDYVLARLAGALNDFGRPLLGAKILVVGVAYKPNVEDIRESPAAALIERLQATGSLVSYHDPHVPVFPRMRHYHIDLESVALTDRLLRDQDAVLIVTNHEAIDYELIGRNAKLVVDTRNAMANVRKCSARVVKA